MSFFTRTLHRLRRAEGGFSLMETVVALGVLFIALLALARTAAVGFTDIANSRQREQANQIANQVLEQVRGLTYERVGQGLKSSDLAGDPAIVSCADGNYYLACSTSDPDAEKIVQSTNAASDVPLVPHQSTYGASQGYTTTYTAAVYVTQAKSVPQTGAYRVTAVVSWNATQRPGVKSSITTQSLLYTPEGTTDATTGSGTAPFFYGTGSIGRAPITITPNAGVTGGTGVTGLPAWDSMTEDLYGLETSVQQQTLTRSESKATLTGAHKVLAGVETTAGGDTAEAIADNDPATTATSTSSPGSLMQSTVAANVSGGGNSLDVVAASGGGGNPCPSTAPTLETMTGWEHGRASTPMGGTSFFWASGTTGTVSVDSAVKRTGNYSWKVNPTNAVAYGSNIMGGATGTGITVMHVAFRLASLPTADVGELIRIGTTTASSFAASFGYKQSTNKFMVRLKNAGNVWQTPVQSSGTVTAGQWYAIDLRWDTSGTTHKIDWQVDGVPQTQATLAGATFVIHYNYHLGTTAAATFTANYDDLQVGHATAQYPYTDAAIKLLLPNGMGTSNIGSTIKDEALQTSTIANWWQKMDEIPAGTADWIQQTANSTANYAEFTLQDTTDTCIRGVEAVLWSAGAGDNKSNNGQLHVVHGGVDSTAWNANLGPNLAGGGVQIGLGSLSSLIAPAGTNWTQSELNGMTARVGYSNDASPVATFHGITIQYLVPAAGEIPEGGAGTETGSSASTTSASAATPCGTPTQVDGRACAYAHEDYSTTGPPHLSAKVDLSGSGAGTAKIYKFSPSTAGGTSYVWGRRAAGTGGVGTVKQTVTRYPGTHEFGALPSGMTGPSGWSSYWVKYDAGTSASVVTAEAGIGSAAPTYSAAGTISYWNGSGYSSMTCPAAGAAIPVTALNQVSGGFRAELSGELACGASSIFPVGATGTATRTESRATLGSPVSGTFTYKITNTSTSAVVANLTVSVDLGSLTATARYAP